MVRLTDGLDPTRAAFEAWVGEEGWAPSDIADRCSDGAPRGGEYRHRGLQDAWEVWQASASAEMERRRLVGFSEVLGPLPKSEATERHPFKYTADQMRAYAAAAVAAERERWQELVDHLRYCRDCGENDVSRCSDGAAIWTRVTGDQPKA